MASSTSMSVAMRSSWEAEPVAEPNRTDLLGMEDGAALNCWEEPDVQVVTMMAQVLILSAADSGWIA